MAESKHAEELVAVAENSKTDDKQFICRICSGNYINPRYLPTCGHTFCENCLLKYTRNVQQEDHGSKFECPDCRKTNNLPEHDEVTLQWVRTFPLNTFIIEKMKSLPQSKEEIKGERRICGPCRATGEASAGSENTEMTKDHKPKDVTTLSTETNQTDFFINVGKCADHPDRDVKIYCKSHDAVICYLCSTFHHKACDMAEIADHAVDDTKLRKDSEMLVMRMKAAIEHLNLLQKLRMETKHNVKEKLKEIRENIEQMRAEVVKLMDNVVSHVLDVTKLIEIEREDVIDAEMARVAKIKELTEQKLVLLDTIGQHGNERHFISAHLVKKQYEETETQITEEDRHLKQLDAKLVLAENLKRLIESTDVEKLVQIKVTESESSHTPLVSACSTLRSDDEPEVNISRDSHLVKVEEHTVRSGPGNNPLFSGISAYGDGRLILSDYQSNGYLHLYDMGNSTELKLMLEGARCAVQIDDNHLAVSTGHDNTIKIVSTDNELRVEKSFQIDNMPLAFVALNNGHLAVAWGCPPAFSVIDISGNGIVKKLYLDQDANGRHFKSFLYLAIDKETQHVIQPCAIDTAVYCFDFTGKPVFTYTHPGLTYPQGVALDNNGNIYVCERSSPGSIHKVSPTGDLISVITEGVPSRPQAICSDVTNTGFWVTRDSVPKYKIAYFRFEKNTKS